MRSQLPSEQQMRAQITERLTNDEERIGVPVTLQEIYAGPSQSSRLECVWFCLRYAIGAHCAAGLSSKIFDFKRLVICRGCRCAAARGPIDSQLRA